MTELRAEQDELESLLARVDGVGELDRRLERLSGHLVDRPYLVNPLCGSPTQQEKLVSRVDGFDCVTFIESVVALAGSSTPEEFEPRLTALRYHLGRVQWLERNHYMSLWLDRNVESGAVAPVLPERWETESSVRNLCCLAGFPGVERHLAYLPLDRIEELFEAARSGDVVCFVSTRSDLDTYHVGLLVVRPAPVPPLIRHASRSAGCVMEESLVDFLQRNETPGFLVARPQPLHPGERH